MAGLVVDHLLGRLLRRAFLFLAFVVFALVAIYELTAAGLLALEASYGLLEARVIVGAVYGVFAVASAIIFWVGRHRPRSTAPVLAAQREMQLVMLVEAAMLGYSLARKTERAP